MSQALIVWLFLWSVLAKKVGQEGLIGLHNLNGFESYYINTIGFKYR